MLREATNRRIRSQLLNYIVLGVLVLIALGPIYVLVSNSLKSQAELATNPLALPSQIRWTNYVQAWEQGRFGTTMRNSLILVVMTIAGVLVLGAPAAYSLARLKSRGSALYMTYILTLSTIPIWLYVVPLFILWRDLGLINNWLGLVLIYIATRSPFAIFLMRSYLVNLPPDFEDAARVDGANELQVLTRVIIPMSYPSFLTTALVVALSTWNEFQLALIFIFDDNLQPVTTSYFKFQERFGADLTLTSAGAVMMIVPVTILFLLLQRRFIEGLTQGGLK